MSPKQKTKPRPPPPLKEDIITRDTALAGLGAFICQLGYDLLVQSPKNSDSPWVVTLWRNDKPDERACSSARSLSAAVNDVVDQMRRPLDERQGVIDDDDDDDDDDFD